VIVQGIQPLGAPVPWREPQWEPEATEENFLRSIDGSGGECRWLHTRYTRHRLQRSRRRRHCHGLGSLPSMRDQSHACRA